MVALKRDVALLRAPEIRIRRKLTRLYFRFPVGTPELVLEKLNSIQPVLDVRTFRYNPRSVPLTDGPQVSWGRWIERVRGAGAREPRFVVRSFDVVEQLVFGCAPINVVVFFGASIEDATIARLADLPLEFQFEVAELVLRHDVTDGCLLHE